MTMLAEEYKVVIEGDPDRDTIDLAVLDTATGGVHAHLAASTDGAGYTRTLARVRRHAPGRRIWALEGTGSFAAGLSDVLAQAGEDVTEVGSLKRARGAKNDRLDAIRAARNALAREHQSSPRARGLREAIRALTATREGVLVSRTKAINELKSLIVAAPEHLRATLRGLSLTKQLSRIEASTTMTTATVEHRVTVLTVQSITARIRFLTGQLDDIDPEPGRLMRQHPAGPALLAQPGVGPVVPARLLLGWSRPGRVRNEAAFASLAAVAPLEASSGQSMLSGHRPSWASLRYLAHQPTTPVTLTEMPADSQRADKTIPRSKVTMRLPAGPEHTAQPSSVGETGPRTTDLPCGLARRPGRRPSLRPCVPAHVEGHRAIAGHRLRHPIGRASGSNTLRCNR